MKSEIKILGLVSCALIFSMTSNVGAQDTNVDWNTASDGQVVLQAIELTTPIPSNEVPSFATFYSAQHSPISAQPWPPLPADINHLPAWDLGSNLWVVDDLDFSYNALSVPATMMAMDAGSPPVPGGGSDGGTNTSSSGGSSIPFDPGTNLWIAQEAVSGGQFTGIASNTIGGTEYELLYANSLNSPIKWIPDGVIVGTDGTNWTPWMLPFDSTTNFFLNVLSLQDNSGTGVPNWWWLQNFGEYTNADANALDPTGDGWTDGQKYAMGISPFAWATPLAPQGLTVNDFNAASDTANLSWLPSPGPVTGYTLQTPNGNVSLAANVTSYTDYSSWPLGSYSVQAEYAGGPSAWSPSVAVGYLSNEQNPGPAQGLTSAEFVPGQLGVTYLALSGIPNNTVTIRLEFFDYTGVGVSSNYDIPISSVTNGLYAFPLSWSPPSDANYVVTAQTIDANGNASPALDFSGGDGISLEPWNWSVPYLDGRAQLKQNLTFLLREPMTSPFNYVYVDSLNLEPASYAYAGLYNTLAPGPFDGETTTNAMDEYLPFEDNYFYRNFVFSPDDANSNGAITGFQLEPPADPLTLVLAPTYQFQEPEDSTNLTALLSTNIAQWLLSYPYWPARSRDAITNGIYYDLESMGVTYTYDAQLYEWEFALGKGAVNYFGLPIQSVELAYFLYTNQDYAGVLATNTLEAGYAVTLGIGWLPFCYPSAEQPQFETVGYNFWSTGPAYFTWGQRIIGYSGSPLPGNPGFATTNTSDVLITSVGNPDFQVAGYAKLAVTNSVYSSVGVYGYLGQYFANAYQIDGNGNVTTNTAGIVSPYGQFFATEPGPAALVTMPDPETGLQGTGSVYCISLNLDKNHDGVMDTSWNGPDATSAGSPYVFWANNNYDRWDFDFPFGTPVQDDQEVAFNPCFDSGNSPMPDCNYLDENCSRAIPCTRDLEDFARLWLSGLTTNLLEALPAGCTISLNWGDVGAPNAANPTIDLFAAADSDGGLGYQTNEDVASAQINNDEYPFIGRVGPGSNLVLNAWLAYNLAGTHFIWCGVSNGTGGLNLTIANSNGTVLARTTAYIQIEDIKQMYERWTVGDNPSLPPTNNAVLETEALSPGTAAFEYAAPQDTNTPYILWVHGYNMPTWTKDRFAETAYKRLYWQGYQGRFGCFNWPTAQKAAEFGSSELQAWESAQGLLNRLNDLNSEYPGNVYLLAHSLGNVVAGEALRLAGSNQVVNTYLALQAAVTAHAYDPTTTEYELWNNVGTPDCYAYYWTNGAPCYFNFSQGAGAYVNFFNVNDWALNFWLKFQNLKPVINPTYGFTPPDSYWNGLANDLTPLYFPTDTYVMFDKIIQSHSYALGAQADVGGVFLRGTNYDQVPMPILWPPDSQNYSAHVWHSSEYRFDNPQMSLFWNEVLIKLGLTEE